MIKININRVNIIYDVSNSDNSHKNSKLSTIIGRGLLLIVFLSIFSGLFNMYSINNNDIQYNLLVDQAFVLESNSKDISYLLESARVLEKEYLLTGNNTVLALHSDINDLINQRVDNIVSLNISVDINNKAKEINSEYKYYKESVGNLFYIYQDKGGGVFSSNNTIVYNIDNVKNDIHNLLTRDFENNQLNESIHNKLIRYYFEVKENEINYNTKRAANEEYDIYVSDISNKIDQFNELLTELNFNSTHIAEYSDNWALYLKNFNSIILADNDIDILTIILDSKTEIIKENTTELEQIARQLIESSQDSVADTLKTNRYVTLYALIILALLGFIFTKYITKSIVDTVQELTDNVRQVSQGDLISDINLNMKSSKEINELTIHFQSMKKSLNTVITSITESNEILSNTGEDLLSGSEQINASAEEVASTSQAMSDGATTQTELISEVNEDVERVQKIVDDIVKKIQLNTQEVSQIALQTNILALNAGIEASRAGDYGRGFAVVAENVRKLSDQSKMASERIETVADEIRGTLQVSFNRISSTMINVVSVSEETAASAEEVAAAAEEMTATIEELSSAASELTSQANKSQELIKQFRIK